MYQKNGYSQVQIRICASAQTELFMRKPAYGFDVYHDDNDDGDDDHNNNNNNNNNTGCFIMNVPNLKPYISVTTNPK
jgi:hypothetical protein